ncbi:hypothetical protein BH09SUM1_BH09SUM1_32320 [soil metagenome]
MRLKLGISAIFAAAALLAPAVGRAGVVGDVVTYGADRGNDLLDIFRIRGGYAHKGKGAGIKARVTSLAQIGYVWFDGRYYGIERRGIGAVDEHRREGGVSLAYGSWNEMQAVAGNIFLKANTDWSEIEDRRILRNLPYWDDGRKRFFSVGAEVATPLLAVDLGVYPEEALDFVIGFTTIDIFNDDALRGYNLENKDATTEPEPKKTAPFQGKQAKFDEFKKRMEAEKADAEANAPDHTPETATLSGQPTRRNATTSQAATTGAIKQDDADAAVKALNTATVAPTAPANADRPAPAVQHTHTTASMPSTPPSEKEANDAAKEKAKQY